MTTEIETVTVDFEEFNENTLSRALEEVRGYRPFTYAPPRWSSSRLMSTSRAFMSYDHRQIEAARKARLPIASPT
jgi:hypothetical protein